MIVGGGDATGGCGVTTSVSVVFLANIWGRKRLWLAMRRGFRPRKRML